MKIVELTEVLDQVELAILASSTEVNNLFIPYVTAKTKLEKLIETRDKIRSLVATLEGIDESIIDGIGAAPVGDNVSLQQALRDGLLGP
jgi:hypothetical protein